MEEYDLIARLLRERDFDEPALAADPYTKALLETALQEGLEMGAQIGAYGAEAITDPIDTLRAFGNRDVAAEQVAEVEERAGAFPSYEPTEDTQLIQQQIMAPMLRGMKRLGEEFPAAADFAAGYMEDPRVQHTMGALPFVAPSMLRAGKAFRDKPDPNQEYVYRAMHPDEYTSAQETGEYAPSKFYQRVFVTETPEQAQQWAEPGAVMVKIPKHESLVPRDAGGETHLTTPLGEGLPFEGSRLLSEELKKPKWGKQSGHLIPADEAVKELEKVDPAKAAMVAAALQSAREAIETAPDFDHPIEEMLYAEAVAQGTGGVIVPIPINGETRLFYRPPIHTSTYMSRTDALSHPGLQNPGDVLETPLGNIYQNPELYEIYPDVANTNVRLMRQQYSFPATMAREGHAIGGGFNPDTGEMEFPLYPKFDEDELQDLQTLMGATVGALREGRTDVPDFLRESDAQHESVMWPSSIGHETEHVMQKLHGLPRGSNLHEQEGLAYFDKRPIVDAQGDQFAYSNGPIIELQREFMRSEVDGEGYLDFQRTMDDRITQLQANMRADPGNADDYIAPINMFQWIKDTAKMEVKKAQKALIDAGVDPQRIEELWPSVRDYVAREALLRVSERSDSYRRYFGEMAANLSGEELAAGALEHEPLSFLAGVGKVAHTKFSTQAKHEGPFTPKTKPVDPDNPTEDEMKKMFEEWIEHKRGSRELDYAELINKLVGK